MVINVIRRGMMSKQIERTIQLILGNPQQLLLCFFVMVFLSTSIFPDYLFEQESFCTEQIEQGEEQSEKEKEENNEEDKIDEILASIVKKEQEVHLAEKSHNREAVSFEILYIDTPEPPPDIA